MCVQLVSACSTSPCFAICPAGIGSYCLASRHLQYNSRSGSAEGQWATDAGCLLVLSAVPHGWSGVLWQPAVLFPVELRWWKLPGEVARNKQLRIAQCEEMHPSSLSPTGKHPVCPFCSYLCGDLALAAAYKMVQLILAFPLAQWVFYDGYMAGWSAPSSA